MIDIYWIHNPMDVEKWTPKLIPLAKSGQIRTIGVSNHNLAEIKRVNGIGITFYAYMVLEQGALTGKYNQEHPFARWKKRQEQYRLN